MNYENGVQTNSTLKNRSIGLDILRIIAAFMIVMQHVSSYGLDNFGVTETGFVASNFYCAIVRWAVPMFFVISGHLFLNREGEFSASKIYKKNFSKLLVIYVIWLTFYGAIDATLDGLNPVAMLVESLRVGLTTSKYHLWFLPSIMGCYLMLPVFKALVEYEDGKYLKCMCILFVIFAIGRQTLFPYTDSLLAIAVRKLDYPLANYMGYFLLGAYLGRIDVEKYRRRYMLMIVVALFAFQILMTQYLSNQAGMWNGLWYGEFLVPTFVEVVLIFLIFRKTDFPQAGDRAKKVVRILAEGTLGVYLMHIYVLEHMYRLNIYSFTQWLSIPVVSLVIFVGCMCVTLIVKKIPFVGKWVV